MQYISGFRVISVCVQSVKISSFFFTMIGEVACFSLFFIGPLACFSRDIWQHWLWYFGSPAHSGETKMTYVEIVYTNLALEEQNNSTTVCTMHCQVKTPEPFSSFKGLGLSEIRFVSPAVVFLPCVSRFSPQRRWKSRGAVA